MRRSSLLLAPCLALLALALLPACAGAWSAPCAPGGGPRCEWWSARTTFIADGDTIRVQVGGRPETIRFTGINAMELHRYSKYASRRRGDCHGVEATAVVERAIRASHGEVRLAAQHASSRTGHRLRRSVWAKVDGSWQDLSRLELERGLVLWLPNEDEWAHNRDYHELAEKAARERRGLYDPAACGRGPDQDLPISVVVNWDADGADSANLDDEWADIVNGGPRPLRLGGWWFRDSWLNVDRRTGRPGYSFPSSAVVPAGGRLRLHMGCGHDTASSLHWCQHSTVFENVTIGPPELGDGGYLFDPDGDLRASMIYPCLVACTDPLLGKVELQVHASAPEAVLLRNTSDEAIDVAGYILRLGVRGSRESFVFSEHLPPSSTIPLHGVRDLTPDRGGGYGFADGGGVMQLVTPDDIVIACDAWGYGRCG